jgi:hypothetical protein
MLKTIKGKAVLAIVLILLGFSLSIAYVVASGALEETVTYTVKLILVGGVLPQLTNIERAELEDKAIRIALSNLQVKELVDGKQYYVNSSLRFRLKVNPQLQQEGENIFLCEWDEKLRAIVAIVFADGSGYYVDVNLTEERVESITYTSNVSPK